VIHAGIYYRPGSSKARLCRAGVNMLVEFCREHDVRHEICGKVVVATSDEEVPRLEELLRRGTANGVPDLELVGPERLREIEPHAGGVRALLSPSTGIVDFGEVARKLASDIEERGGTFRFGTRVQGAATTTRSIVLETTTGVLEADRVVSCAGLYADRFTRVAGVGDPIALSDDPQGNTAGEMRVVPFRGEYWALRRERRYLVKSLIYPVPDPRFPFLGVHFTRRVDGSVEAGPNAVLALSREGYRKFDVRLEEAWWTLGWAPFWKMARRHWREGAAEVVRSFSRQKFAEALARLVPEIRADDLEPGGSGVRAQILTSDGALLDDFAVTRSGRVVHVLNAPSPAATSSLAIGERIARLVME
jgi:L-2-hydroxyglutarate oxidase LhgO